MSNLFNIAHLGAAFAAGAVVVGVLQRLALTNRLAGVDVREWRLARTSWAEAAVPADLRRGGHRMRVREQVRADWADLVAWATRRGTPVPAPAEVPAAVVDEPDSDEPTVELELPAVGRAAVMPPHIAAVYGLDQPAEPTPGEEIAWRADRLHHETEAMDADRDARLDDLDWPHADEDLAPVNGQPDGQPGSDNTTKPIRNLRKRKTGGRKRRAKAGAR